MRRPYSTRLHLPFLLSRQVPGNRPFAARVAPIEDRRTRSLCRTPFARCRARHNSETRTTPSPSSARPRPLQQNRPASPTVPLHAPSASARSFGASSRALRRLKRNAFMPSRNHGSVCRARGTQRQSAAGMSRLRATSRPARQLRACDSRHRRGRGFPRHIAPTGPVGVPYACPPIVRKSGKRSGAPHGSPDNLRGLAVEELLLPCRSARRELFVALGVSAPPRRGTSVFTP